MSSGSTEENTFLHTESHSDHARTGKTNAQHTTQHPETKLPALRIHTCELATAPTFYSRFTCRNDAKKLVYRYLGQPAQGVFDDPTVFMTSLEIDQLLSDVDSPQTLLDIIQMCKRRRLSTQSVRKFMIFVTCILVMRTCEEFEQHTASRGIEAKAFPNALVSLVTQLDETHKSVLWSMWTQHLRQIQERRASALNKLSTVAESSHRGSTPNDSGSHGHCITKRSEEDEPVDCVARSAELATPSQKGVASGEAKSAGFMTPRSKPRNLTVKPPPSTPRHAPVAVDKDGVPYLISPKPPAQIEIFTPVRSPLVEENKFFVTRTTPNPDCGALSQQSEICSLNQVTTSAPSAQKETVLQLISTSVTMDPVLIGLEVSSKEELGSISTDAKSMVDLNANTTLRLAVSCPLPYPWLEQSQDTDRDFSDQTEDYLECHPVEITAKFEPLRPEDFVALASATIDVESTKNPNRKVVVGGFPMMYTRIDAYCRQMVLDVLINRQYARKWLRRRIRSELRKQVKSQTSDVITYIRNLVALLDALCQFPFEVDEVDGSHETMPGQSKGEHQVGAPDNSLVQGYDEALESARSRAHVELIAMNLILDEGEAHSLDASQVEMCIHAAGGALLLLVVCVNAFVCRLQFPTFNSLMECCYRVRQLLADPTSLRVEQIESVISTSTHAQQSVAHAFARGLISLIFPSTRYRQEWSPAKSTSEFEREAKFITELARHGIGLSKCRRAIIFCLLQTDILSSAEIRCEDIEALLASISCPAVLLVTLELLLQDPSYSVNDVSSLIEDVLRLHDRIQAAFRSELLSKATAGMENELPLANGSPPTAESDVVISVDTTSVQQSGDGPGKKLGQDDVPLSVTAPLGLPLKSKVMLPFTPSESRTEKDDISSPKSITSTVYSFCNSASLLKSSSSRRVWDRTAHRSMKQTLARFIDVPSSDSDSEEDSTSPSGRSGVNETTDCVVNDEMESDSQSIRSHHKRSKQSKVRPKPIEVLEVPSPADDEELMIELVDFDDNDLDTVSEGVELEQDDMSKSVAKETGSKVAEFELAAGNSIGSDPLRPFVRFDAKSRPCTSPRNGDSEVVDLAASTDSIDTNDAIFSEHDQPRIAKKLPPERPLVPPLNLKVINTRPIHRGAITHTNANLSSVFTPSSNATPCNEQHIMTPVYDTRFQFIPPVREMTSQRTTFSFITEGESDVGGHSSGSRQTSLVSKETNGLETRRRQPSLYQRDPPSARVASLPATVIEKLILQQHLAYQQNGLFTTVIQAESSPNFAWAGSSSSFPMIPIPRDCARQLADAQKCAEHGQCALTRGSSCGSPHSNGGREACFAKLPLCPRLTRQLAIEELVRITNGAIRLIGDVHTERLIAKCGGAFAVLFAIEILEKTNLVSWFENDLRSKHKLTRATLDKTLRLMKAGDSGVHSDIPPQYLYQQGTPFESILPDNATMIPPVQPSQYSFSLASFASSPEFAHLPSRRFASATSTGSRGPMYLGDRADELGSFIDSPGKFRRWDAGISPYLETRRLHYNTLSRCSPSTNAMYSSSRRGRYPTQVGFKQYLQDYSLPRPFQSGFQNLAPPNIRYQHRFRPESESDMLPPPPPQSSYPSPSVRSDHGSLRFLDCIEDLSIQGDRDLRGSAVICVDRLCVGSPQSNIFCQPDILEQTQLLPTELTEPYIILVLQLKQIEEQVMAMVAILQSVLQLLALPLTSRNYKSFMAELQSPTPLSAHSPSTNIRDVNGVARSDRLDGKRFNFLYPSRGSAFVSPEARPHLPSGKFTSRITLSAQSTKSQPLGGVGNDLDPKQTAWKQNTIETAKSLLESNYLLSSQQRRVLLQLLDGELLAEDLSKYRSLVAAQSDFVESQTREKVFTAIVGCECLLCICAEFNWSLCLAKPRDFMPNETLPPMIIRQSSYVSTSNSDLAVPARPGPRQHPCTSEKTAPGQPEIHIPEPSILSLNMRSDAATTAQSHSKRSSTRTDRTPVLRSSTLSSESKCMKAQITVSSSSSAWQPEASDLCTPFEQDDSEECTSLGFSANTAETSHSSISGVGAPLALPSAVELQLLRAQYPVLPPISFSRILPLSVAKTITSKDIDRLIEAGKGTETTFNVIRQLKGAGNTFQTLHELLLTLRVVALTLPFAPTNPPAASSPYSLSSDSTAASREATRLTIKSPKQSTLTAVREEASGGNLGQRFKPTVESPKWTSSPTRSRHKSPVLTQPRCTEQAARTSQAFQSLATK